MFLNISLLLQEANGELNADVIAKIPVSPTLDGVSLTNNQWSVKQMIAEFTELCQWLTSMQEEVYASPENLANKTLRAVNIYFHL